MPVKVVLLHSVQTPPPGHPGRNGRSARPGPGPRHDDLAREGTTMLKQQRGARRPANRTARPGLALAAGLLLAATAAAARAAVTTTIVSGLGWRSGTNTGGYPC